MFLFVRLQGQDRLQVSLGQEAEKSWEIELPLTHGQMFVTLMMIIVEMDLTEKIPQGIDPFREGNFTEDIVVARIEAKSESRRIDFPEEQEQRVRVLLEDVFDGQSEPLGFGFLDQRPPGLETAFEPEVHVSIKFPSFVPGVKDDVLRLKEFSQLDDLREAVRGDLLDSPIHASGTEIHERAVESDLQPVVAKGPGQLPRLFFIAVIEIIATEIDFRVNTVLNRKIKSLQKRRIGDVDLDGGHGFFHVPRIGKSD
jgi:hypothetical protein